MGKLLLHSTEFCCVYTHRFSQVQQGQHGELIKIGYLPMTVALGIVSHYRSTLPGSVCIQTPLECSDHWDYCAHASLWNQIFRAKSSSPSNISVSFHLAEISRKTPEKYGKCGPILTIYTQNYRYRQAIFFSPLDQCRSPFLSNQQVISTLSV